MDNAFRKCFKCGGLRVVLGRFSYFLKTGWFGTTAFYSSDVNIITSPPQIILDDLEAHLCVDCGLVFTEGEKGISVVGRHNGNALPEHSRNCFKCGSVRVFNGFFSFSSPSDDGWLSTKPTFYAVDIKPFVWTLTTPPRINMENQDAHLCIGCGLIFSEAKVDTLDLERRFRIWGTDTIQKYLGLKD